MVRWAEKLPAETVVLVEGIVCEPNDKKHEGVKSAEVHDVEIQILKARPVLFRADCSEERLLT